MKKLRFDEAVENLIGPVYRAVILKKSINKKFKKIQKRLDKRRSFKHIKKILFGQ